MNKLIALTALIILFNFVKYGSSEAPICRATRGDPEKLSIFADCINNNFPAVVLDVIAQCYQTSFGSPGQTRDLLNQLCAEGKDIEGLSAMEQCMNNEGEINKDIDDGDIEKAVLDVELCYLQKAHLSLTDLANLANDDDDDDEDEKK